MLAFNLVPLSRRSADDRSGGEVFASEFSRAMTPKVFIIRLFCVRVIGPGIFGMRCSTGWSGFIGENIRNISMDRFRRGK